MTLAPQGANHGDVAVVDAEGGDVQPADHSGAAVQVRHAGLDLVALVVRRSEGTSEVVDPDLVAIEKRDPPARHGDGSGAIARVGETTLGVDDYLRATVDAFAANDGGEARE